MSLVSEMAEAANTRSPEGRNDISRIENHPRCSVDQELRTRASTTMSEKKTSLGSGQAKARTSTQTARTRPNTKPPPTSTIFTPFSFLLISGLAYLFLQSSEYKLDPSRIYRKGLTYFSQTGVNVRGNDAPGLYAICSREGNQIYTSELDTPQIQCVLVNNDTIIGLGAQGRSIC
jgi:hypothetical protein